MNSKIHEEIVLKKLKMLDLRVERFPKHMQHIQGNKTPDFLVYSGDKMAFYCEVKEFKDTDSLEDHLQSASSPNYIALRGGNEKPFINRLDRRISKAITQFDSVDAERKLPRVLAIVNTDSRTYPDILVEIFQGGVKTSSGRNFITMPHHITERARLLYSKIDLYWWIEKHAFDSGSYYLGTDLEESEKQRSLKHLFRIT